VVPQVETACVAHSPSGSRLATMASQKPTRPDWVHLSQVPLHAPSQHTPSAQKPDAHSVDTLQFVPCAFLQTPIAQLKPLAQSPVPEHVTRHRPVVDSHASGEHEALPRSTHAPSPSQVSASDETVPAHDAATHSVPIA
jgi:hypothetical protein